MVLDTPRFPKAGTPAYLSLLKGDVNILKWNWVQDYQKHFKTGSFKPVMHAMLIIGTVGYTLDYWQHLRCELISRDARPPPRLRAPTPSPDPHTQKEHIRLTLPPPYTQSNGTRTRRSTSATLITRRFLPCLPIMRTYAARTRHISRARPSFPF